MNEYTSQDPRVHAMLDFIKASIEPQEVPSELEEIRDLFGVEETLDEGRVPKRLDEMLQYLQYDSALRGYNRMMQDFRKAVEERIPKKRVKLDEDARVPKSSVLVFLDDQNGERPLEYAFFDKDGNHVRACDPSRRAINKQFGYGKAEHEAFKLMKRTKPSFKHVGIVHMNDGYNAFEMLEEFWSLAHDPVLVELWTDRYSSF